MIDSRPWAVALLCAVAPAALAADKKVDFSRDIRPILADKCFACHGLDTKKVKGGLRLDLAETATRKNDGGRAAIVPGKPQASLVIERIHASDATKLMPPPSSKKTLTSAEKQLLKDWIAQGAEYQGHWAYQPPVKAAPPNVKQVGWSSDPVDRFILARQEKEGLTPNGPAALYALIRRVTLDLTGLPPTPEEVEAFLKDCASAKPQALDAAYEKVVDRLLKSPRYGEHMARHWLDAARYGDTHGMHLDNYREMFPYRDWVIRAFNANMPFDRFLHEQIAGDLMPNATLEQRVATGFLRCHVTTSEGGSIEEEVYVRNVFDRVDTNGLVLFGLTVGCAKCHNHPYDPVSAKEYYQLFAFFNNLDGSPLDGNIARHPPVVSVPTKEQAAKLAKLDTEIAALKTRVAEVLADAKYDSTIDLVAKSPAPRQAGPFDTFTAWLRFQQSIAGKDLPKEIQDLVKLDSKKHDAAQKKKLLGYFVEHAWSQTRDILAPVQQKLRPLEQARQKLDKEIPATLIYKERSDVKPAYFLKRGEYEQRGDKVDRTTPSFLPPFPEKAPRNRLGFALWLTDPRHPLTARVAVNRFWQQLFGVGLVKTAEDFGVQGDLPSHPELLDWLSVTFMENGWDVQKLMKRLVTSATYRQSARVTKEHLVKDRENRLLARSPRLRLDAEMLRDQALFVGGLLVERQGGPSVKPPQPSGLWEAVAFTGSDTGIFKADTGHEKVHRRSMYIFWKRTAAPPMMTALDAPSREACVVRRERTNTPLQALLLMNEQQYVEAARALAERTLKHGGATTEARLQYLFKTVTSRGAHSLEVSELTGLLRDNAARFAQEPKAAQGLIAVGETRPDPALNPAELAAWTLVANVVLNMDEVVSK